MRISAKHIILGFSAPILTILLSGCVASFQGDRLDSITSYPSVKQQKTMFVKMTYSAKVNGEDWSENILRNGTYLKNRCVDHLQSSDMFSLVSGDLSTTDLQLYVAIINEKETNTARHTLSALTLFLIPYNSTDTFRVLAILKNPSTGKKTTIRLTDHVTHRQHLFMAPFAPFKTSGSEISMCADRVFENLCREIHRTGMLE